MIVTEWSDTGFLEVNCLHIMSCLKTTYEENCDNIEEKCNRVQLQIEDILDGISGHMG